MNRIYKVIWSKVKNQYVVVSELAHSNGKQSRTGKRSLRSRIAALVVCGAIAAFGVYGTVPMEQAFAVEGGTATAGQYIAVAVDTNNNSYQEQQRVNGRWQWVTVNYEVGDERQFEDAEGNSYNYTYVSVQDTNGEYHNYWVRDGYTIEIDNEKRYNGAQNDLIIKAYKDSEETSNAGLISSYQTASSAGNITTATGYNIQDSNTGMYGGAVNTGGVETPSTYGYNLDLSGNGSYSTRVSYNNIGTYFKEVTLENGIYRYNGQAVATNNLYVIGGTVGVFVNPNTNSVYTGNVYGDNNEILMSGMSNNEIYTYWGAEIDDPRATISNMTISQYNQDRQELKNDIKGIHGDDIEKITLGQSEQGGGTISLDRYGAYDAATDSYTGEYSVDGTIKITSEGGTNGDDVKIRFDNRYTDDEGQQQGGTFTVDVGSKVVANATEGTESGTLSSVSINGNVYTLPTGTTYTKGNGIAISDENVISVDLAKDSEQNNISGLHFDENGGLANNLKVTADTSEGTHSDGGNWTITDTAQANEIFKNTTLSSVSNTEIDNGEEGDNRVVYGNNYTISDTDGNTVTLKDVASASKLEDVDTRVTNVENDTITGGSISDSGKISLTQQDGTSLTLDNAIHDYALVDKEGGYSVENNSVTLDVQDQYGNGTDRTVTINGIASTADVAAAKTEVKAGTNIASIGTSTDETDKHTIYTINAEGAKVSADSNFIVTPKTDEVTNITDYNIGLANTVTIGSGENAKPVKIDGVNGEVTGLTNTTLDVTGFATSNRAATEEQLKAAMEEFEGNNYTGWTVSANGQNGSTVASGKTVDFSGVTVGEGDDATSNVTVTKTTDDDGNTQLAFDLGSDLNITNITANGSITANNMYVTTTDGTNNKSVVNVEYFNANEKHIATSEDKDYPENGYTVDKNTHTVTLTEVDGSGTATGNSVVIKDVASADDLADVKADVDAGWTAQVNGNAAKNVTPESPTLNFVDGTNTNVSYDGGIKVSLNDDVILDADTTEVTLLY